jgi:hypothetical protein
MAVTHSAVPEARRLGPPEDLEGRRLGGCSFTLGRWRRPWTEDREAASGLGREEGGEPGASWSTTEPGRAGAKGYPESGGHG